MNKTAQDLVADARRRIREASATQVAQRHGDVILIDVREPDEFERAHLPGAINIPRGVLEFQVDSHPALAGRDRPIIVYCRSGGRSALAVASLEQMGFSDVVSMAGGINAWSEARLPLGSR